MGFERFLERFPPNQRNVTEGSPASAAAVVSQQGRQARPAAAWLVNIFIAMCKPNPNLLDESSKDRRKFSHSGLQRCGKRCYTFDKWPFLVQACSRCISPPPTRLVAFPATSVAVWPVRVCARVVDNFLFISILFLIKAPTL